MMRSVPLIALLLLASFFSVQGPAWAQSEEPAGAEAPGRGAEAIADAETPSRNIGLPQEEIFHPVLGDPKEPHTFVTLLGTSSRDRSTTIGAVAFGERSGIVRHKGQRDEDGRPARILVCEAYHDDGKESVCRASAASPRVPVGRDSQISILSTSSRPMTIRSIERGRPLMRAATIVSDEYPLRDLELSAVP